MFQNKSISPNVPWQILTTIAAGLVTVNVLILVKLMERFEMVQIAPLVMVVGGLIVALGGFVLTTRARYEVFPTTKQITGSLLNGLLISGALLSLLMILSHSADALVISLYLFACVGAIEFLSLRIFQNRKVTILRVIGLAMLLFSVYFIGEIFPTDSYYVRMFVGLLIGKELLGRVTQTYLLSPWVNSIWNGATVVLSGLSFTLLISSKDIYIEISSAFLLPMWVGVSVMLMGFSMLIIQFLKRKVGIAGGYLQYKLQFWTLTLAFFALVITTQDIKTVLVSFGSILILYPIAEATLFAKG